MSEPTEATSDSAGASPPAAKARPRRRVGKLRGTIPAWQVILFGGLCVALVFGMWWILTYGEVSEERIVSRVKMPSPGETFAQAESLFKERKVDVNTLVSLKRVVLGFALAVAVGVPVGVFAGCYPRVAAFLAPISVFGRNAPMAALIPLTLLLFGGSEGQKIMFIFLAAFAFIITDSAQAIRDVSSRYIDTAFTLGATRGQTIRKVLVPLAMPNIFNSLRLLFGLAFGYIMLVEVVQDDARFGGIGSIINISQHRGPAEHIYLILMIIPLVALVIDRFLYWVQRELFPYQYDAYGIFARMWKRISYGGLSLSQSVFPSDAQAEYEQVLTELKATTTQPTASSPSAIN
jgi:ABC-type nitrate/sulfonate/bicarbonate transport system permease component